MSNCDDQSGDDMVFLDSCYDDVLRVLSFHNRSDGKPYGGVNADSQAAPVAQASVPAEASPAPPAITGSSGGTGVGAGRCIACTAWLDNNGNGWTRCEPQGSMCPQCLDYVVEVTLPVKQEKNWKEKSLVQIYTWGLPSWIDAERLEPLKDEVAITCGVDCKSVTIKGI